MRYLRLIIGSLIIVSALYIIVGEHVRGASSNAFVNAPVVTVRAPVAGDVTIPNRPVGAEVSKDTILFSLNDSRADEVHLDDLLLERAKTQAEIERLTALQTASAARLDEIETQYAAYATDRLRELQLKAGEDQTGPVLNLTDPEKLDLPLVPQTGEEQVVSRDDTAARFGTVPGSYSDLLGLQIDAAARRVFLDDSAGASWNFAYWRGAATQDLARVSADLENARAVLAAYDERIDLERVRLIELTGGDITSPATGIVWEQMVGNGVNVQRGDPVMRIADCTSSVVSLSVSEIVYNRLRTGDAATFRFSGDKRVMHGTIARLAGAGAATVYNEMAVKPGHEHLERYDVTLFVPELRGSDLAGGCNIGRTGRVFFDNRPLDPLRRLLN